ncbi:MAG: alpha/beta hydrolase [Oscillospiraceae bacterium]|nr:alpha/beta hydrolase [Oscillospiraceae bacterium]
MIFVNEEHDGIMICLVRDISVYYEEYGKGKPVLFIHGSHVDHRMMVDPFEPIFNEKQGYRRIYLDLPGRGKTPPASWIKNSDNILEIVMDFIDAIIGDENFLLAGCSYGGYISLGLICKMEHRIDGVLLLCPQIDPREDECLPDKQIIYKSEKTDLEVMSSDTDKFYLNMTVIASPQTFDKWQTIIAPALQIADGEFISNYNDWYSDDFHRSVSNVVFDKPSCILTGRQDNITGYRIANELVERFTRATFAILDCAGHMLQAERESLFGQLVKDWTDRVEQYS